MNAETLAVKVARGALLEVGLGEIAAGVYANRAGFPSHRALKDWPQAWPLVVKAFWMGHVASGHRDAVVDDVDGRPCLTCPTCWSQRPVKR